MRADGRRRSGARAPSRPGRRSSSPCPRCGWTPPWSTSTARTGWGNGQYLGPDPYFDDLFCEAADSAYVSCERIVDTADLTEDAVPQTLLIRRHTVTGVVEAPNGAHFTSCSPDHDRDEALQRHYATTQWPLFAERFLSGDEHAYQAAVRAWQKERS